jgi:hypothetical protein
MNDYNIIRDKLIDIIHLFVIRDYETLAAKYLLDSRDINDFVRALNEYWEFWDHEGIVTTPPKEEFMTLDIIEVNKPVKAGKEFSLLFDLWINGEKSDLTLDCNVEYYSDDDLRIYLYDLHVL